MKRFIILSLALTLLTACAVAKNTQSEQLLPKNIQICKDIVLSQGKSTIQDPNVIIIRWRAKNYIFGISYNTKEKTLQLAEQQLGKDDNTVLVLTYSEKEGTFNLTLYSSDGRPLGNTSLSTGDGLELFKLFVGDLKDFKIINEIET